MRGVRRKVNIELVKYFARGKGGKYGNEALGVSLRRKLKCKKVETVFKIRS